MELSSIWNTIVRSVVSQGKQNHTNNKEGIMFIKVKQPTVEITTVQQETLQYLYHN